jgi:hypothetical protein
MFRQVGGQRCPSPCTRNQVLGTLAVERPWKRQDDPAPRHGDSIHLTGFFFSPGSSSPPQRGRRFRSGEPYWLGSGSVKPPLPRSFSLAFDPRTGCFHARCTQNARTAASIALRDAGASTCLAGVGVPMESSSCKGARRYTPPGMHEHWRPGMPITRADDCDPSCGFRRPRQYAAGSQFFVLA